MPNAQQLHGKTNLDTSKPKNDKAYGWKRDHPKMAKIQHLCNDPDGIKVLEEGARGDSVYFKIGCLHRCSNVDDEMKRRKGNI